MVIWEEIARDGAQAKILLTGQQRVRIARIQSALFGEHGPHHLVFAVGYPSICGDEFEAIRYVAANVDCCSLVTHGRATRSDIDLGLQAINGARFGRVSFAIPMAEEHSRAMLHQSQEETLRQSLDLAKYAVDKAGGVPIDIALGGGAETEVEQLLEAAVALTEAGVSTIKICDSAGKRFPLEIRRLFSELTAQLPSSVVIGAHLHDDFGLALANNLEAIRFGTRLVASSWLGLSERTGLAATEQLIFALSHQVESLNERLGISGPLWKTAPDLRMLTPIAHEVGQMVQVPIKSTDPVVSSAMNHIATGAYFNDPGIFKPFDPEAVLGVPPTLFLTHLANRKIVTTIASNLGFSLDRDQVDNALKWVKRTAFEQGSSIIAEDQFATYLSELCR
jgi:2-isopropylmalate synthase